MNSNQDKGRSASIMGTLASTSVEYMPSILVTTSQPC